MTTENRHDCRGCRGSGRIVRMNGRLDACPRCAAEAEARWQRRFYPPVEAANGAQIIRRRRPAEHFVPTMGL